MTHKTSWTCLDLALVSAQCLVDDMARQQRNIFELIDPCVNAGSEIDSSGCEADDTV